MIYDLVKLGGSVLTDKREPLTLRRDVLDRIAQEIGEGIRNERWQTGAGLVLVHGAGSFGHPRALEGGLSAISDGTDGISNRADVKAPFADFTPPAAPAGATSPSLRDSLVTIQAEVRRLHFALLESLLAAGVPAISLPGAGFLRLNNGRLERPDLTELLRATTHGLVPLTCGEAIVDPTSGPRIVSGDRVMLEICRQAEPERVTFVTDVEGVYDRDPAEPEARLLHQLTFESERPPFHPGTPNRADRSADPPPGSTRGRVADVTGGMEGKLGVLSQIADPHRTTLVLSGLEPGRLRSHLRGLYVPGTRVESVPPR